jgi:hypothetical protein
LAGQGIFGLMAAKHLKRPRDFSQAAKLVIDVATGQVEDEPETEETAAIAFARLGGLKGGVVRAATLSPAERKRIDHPLRRAGK